MSSLQQRLRITISHRNIIISPTHSSIFNTNMKSKPIINDSNFPKPPPKQPLFIVRPKPTQPRLQAPTIQLTRQQRSPTAACQSPLRSIDECLASLQEQLEQEQTMPRGMCLRVREHLLTLRLRYHSEQQSYNDNLQEADPPTTTLLRKPSSRFFRPQRTEADDTRNKENLLSIEGYSTNKMVKAKSKKEDSQIQIHTLETKLRAMSERMQEYERDHSSFQARIRQLERQVDKVMREKAQLRADFDVKIREKKKVECQLRSLLEDIGQRQNRLERQYQQTSGCLEERQKEIISLWQLLSR